MKKNYTKEDYERIHHLVYDYQDGDQKAGEELISSFSKFIGKYVALLHYGHFNLNHGSTRRFLKLFTSDPAKRKAITPEKHNKSSVLIADATTRYIVIRFKKLSVEDIKNELICTLLVMAKKYKDTKPSFQNHIEKNFHFYAYRSFEKLISDPCGYSIIPRKIYHSDETVDVTIDMIEARPDNAVEVEMKAVEDRIATEQIHRGSIIKPNDEGEVSIFENSFINPNWANGVTCGEVFKTLSIFERRLLMMWHVEGKTDSEIAEHFGVCRGTINSKRAKAKEKLKNEFKRLNLSVK